MTDPWQIETLGGGPPVQADGSVGGRPFYFRARYDSWRFDLALEAGADQEAAMEVGAGERVGWQRRATWSCDMLPEGSEDRQYDCDHQFCAGYMPLATARELIEACVGEFLAGAPSASFEETNMARSYRTLRSQLAAGQLRFASRPQGWYSVVGFTDVPVGEQSEQAIANITNDPTLALPEPAPVTTPGEPPTASGAFTTSDLTREGFESWLANTDDALQQFKRSVAPVALDESVQSLSELEQWLLARYDSVEALLDADQELVLDGAARYLGEVMRKQVGGTWDMVFDDPKFIYRRLPIIHVPNKHQVPFCPHFTVRLAVLRRSGELLESVVRKAIRHTSS